MNYLERNALIVSEFQSTRMPTKPGDVIGTSTFTEFRTLGTIKSDTLGRTLYVGLKSGRNGLMQSEFALTARVSEELAVISAIADRFPHLLEELPAFHALLKVGRTTKGIITEDFSEGGKKPVDYGNVWGPQEIQRLYPDVRMSDDALLHIGIRVDGERKLVDFYPMYEVFWDNGAELLQLPQVKAAVPKSHTVYIRK